MQLANSFQRRQHVPPQLPYTMDAFEPYLSKEALRVPCRTRQGRA